MIGKVLKGYCNGYFGSSYGDKRIILQGSDNNDLPWIVALDKNGCPVVAEFTSQEEMLDYVAIWENDHD